MLALLGGIRGSLRLRWILLIFLLIFSSSLLPGFLLHLLWGGRIFPGVVVSRIPVGGLVLSQATSILDTHTSQFLDEPLVLSSETETWNVDVREIGLRYETESTAQAAYLYGRRTGFFGGPSLFRAVTSQVQIPLSYTYDSDSLEATISAIADSLDVPSVAPAIQLLEAPHPETGARVEVSPGEDGRRLDASSLRRELNRRFSDLSSAPLALETQLFSASEGRVDVSLTQMRAERLLPKTIELSYESSEAGAQPLSWELGGKDLVHFLSFGGGFDREKIASYSATLAENIDRPPQNATFVFQGGRVAEFAPERSGLRLNVQETVDRLVRAFSDLELSEEDVAAVVLPVSITQAKITSSDVNDLGIVELLGRGDSTFHGSIANREHNIVLSASRIAGILIPPGETFSFNVNVGDISAATGYRQAYIIKSGRTILDDGGGVCQVSTTLFRAVMDAGLPIVERTAHSYRVSYYEQNSKPGFDATVFAPRVDLKFLNDTPAHLLIQAVADTSSNTLTFEIYGTSDGRKSTISNHRVWDVSPPPPDLYQDDPTLPAGTVKQVDWSAWGAKVKYDYQVERDGEIIFEKSFYSNFRPWQSVFLQGTG